MADAALSAHSLTEAYLFLMATPCGSCGKGPLRGEATSPPGAASPPSDVEVQAVCAACGQVTSWPFRLSGVNLGDEGTEQSGVASRFIRGALPPASPTRGDATSERHALDLAPTSVINATDEPSRILDVAQWVTLSGMIAQSAASQSDKSTRRRLLIEAALCLDEALKFYVADNDLPPPEAFFHKGSRLRFRRNPEQFSRQRLLHLRSQLPASTPRA